MKKLLALLVVLSAIFMVAGAAYAAPFLVCDPPSTTDRSSQGFTYKIFGIPNVDGSSPTEGIDVVPEDVGAEYGFKYDIGYLISGTEFTVTVKACNIYGCSDPSDEFVFTPGLPGKPSNIRFVQ